jgi:hypothetical protein
LEKRKESDTERVKRSIALVAIMESVPGVKVIVLIRLAKSIKEFRV